ncbi:MAG: DUF2961 domain-containing protein [Calditrichaeota bacterium]|nr:DUF2961 domain-containing protein [Calditrichota bacterium]
MKHQHRLNRRVSGGSRGVFLGLGILPVLILLSTLSAQSLWETLLSPARLPVLKPYRLVQISSFDSTGGNEDRIQIPPGRTVPLAQITGPGIITRIWLTIDSRDPYFLRRLLLRMYWDDETHPSVEVPIGDFFGNGFQYTHYISQFLGMSSGGYYCYFPMPFRRSARIEVENQSDFEVLAFYYQIDYQQLNQSLPEDAAYFHAFWNRDIRTPPGKPYTVLEARGKGHFVGMNLHMQSHQNRLWFLEGDEMIYVDDESVPSIHGTGTEDYFTSGWYFQHGPFSAPFHGLLLKDDSLARVVAYRFHVADAIPFTSAFRFTIEHGHANQEVADYSSTAYWYQLEPHQPFPPILPASLRIPLRVTIPPGVREFETLRPLETNVDYQVEDMRSWGPDWSQLQQLYVRVSQSGEAFTLELSDLEERAYAIGVYYTRGPDYGKVTVFSGDTVVGRWNGHAPRVRPGGRMSLKPISVKNGKITLRFRVESGEHPSALAVGLDAYRLEPVREFIPEWMIIGPFPNPMRSEKERLGLDVVYPPERELDFTRRYRGADDQWVRWQRILTPDDGRIHLWNRFQPYERVVAYAFTYVYSPRDQVLPLLIGSDDGIKIYVNGKPVFQKLEVRIAMPDQDRIPVRLCKGWNRLLLKIENNLGGYAFFARFLDPGRELTYRLDPPER